MGEENTVIYGLEEEYHSVETPEASVGEFSEFQLIPTQDPPSDDAVALNPDSLAFIDSPTTNSSQVTGSVDTTAPTQSQQEWGSSMKRPGEAASYIESKGFGWLLEVDEEDDEASKPLL